MTALRKPDHWTESYQRKAARAYDLFKFGWDTSQIAMSMHTSEERALKYVSIGRAQARGLPIPYEGV